MSHFSSHLNLYSADEQNKLDIDVLNDKATLSLSNVPLELSVSNLKLNSIANVEGAITALQSDLLTNSSNAASASNTVQVNLDSYVSSNDTALAALDLRVVNNKTARQVADQAHSLAINQEVSNRLAADTALTSSITSVSSDLAAETTARQLALTAEASARSTAISAVLGAVNVEKGRIDAILNNSTVDLDQFSEVLSRFSSSDATLVSEVASLQSQLDTINARLDALTTGN